MNKITTPPPELRYFSSNVQLRALDAENKEESRTIEGYAFKYNVWSNKMGWFIEKIERSFLDDIDLNEDDIVALFNHNRDKILARTISKTLELINDETGLLYRFEAPRNSVGDDLLESIKRGDIRHSSFSFSIKEDSWEYGEDGEPDKRTLIKAEKLYDVSPVVFPAYPDTTAAQRSYDGFKEKMKPQSYHRREMARRKLIIL